jgi:type I restriction-modification system DNA methylase subunit
VEIACDGAGPVGAGPGWEYVRTVRSSVTRTEALQEVGQIARVIPADLLRGPYKPHQYGRVILPLTVLRRLDCVLKPTKAKVLEKHAALKDSKIKEPEPILNKVAGHAFHNTSKLNFQKLKGDPDKAAQNLSHYIKSFSSRARQVFEYFESEKEIAKLDTPMVKNWEHSNVEPICLAGPFA